MDSKFVVVAVLLAAALGFYAGSTASQSPAPQATAVPREEAFLSFDHCLAYYAETARSNAALEAAGHSCRNLTE